MICCITASLLNSLSTQLLGIIIDSLLNCLTGLWTASNSHSLLTSISLPYISLFLSSHDNPKLSQHPFCPLSPYQNVTANTSPLAHILMLPAPFSILPIPLLAASHRACQASALCLSHINNGVSLHFLKLYAHPSCPPFTTQVHICCLHGHFCLLTLVTLLLHIHAWKTSLDYSRKPLLCLLHKIFPQTHPFCIAHNACYARGHYSITVPHVTEVKL